jgi:general secretion pathway protein F
MPVFDYESLAADGSRNRGVMDAESETAVRDRLRSDGQYPVSIARSPDGGHSGRKIGDLVNFSRISRTEINVFTRQLATLTGAGMPLDSALSAIAGQIGNQAFKQVVIQLKEAVNEGVSLSSALQSQPQLFSSMYINMVRAGEAFGSLDLVLSRLADFGDRFDEINGRFRAAMIYPIFMTIIGTGVLFILITFVVPDIMQIYAGMEKALPLPTQLLIGLASFFRSSWWLLLVVLVGGIAALRMFVETASGKQVRDRLLLTLPVLGKVVNKNVLFRFSSTLESLLSSGVDIVDSLEISKRVVDNRCISAVIDEAIEDIRVGKSLVPAFARSEWFPSTFNQMLAIGESSGKLEEMLKKIAAGAERELESTTRGLTSLIEPVLIVIMGILVGFIVLSILLPIFEMNQVIR